MIRLSKFTDYGLLVMACMAEDRAHRPLRAARDVAAKSKLPLPTVSRLLKLLQQGGLLRSHRGIRGGYTLAREPRQISLLEIIAALEGPVALTECSTEIPGLCSLEKCCSIKANQQLISMAVRGALANITLLDLAQPLQLTSIKDGRGKSIPTIQVAPGGVS